MNNNSRKVFFCKCGHNEHQFIIENIEYGASVSVSLADNLHFFNRVRLAIRYVFGHRSRYGMFAEIILDPCDIDELVDFLGKVNYEDKENVHSP
jgi:hypothetical protein